MTAYEEILQKAKNQGLDIDGKNIVIPIAENKLIFNGEMRFGRIFDTVAYVLRDVEEPLSENGYASEPFVYRLVDHYETWITSNPIAYRIDFYIVE